MKTIILSALSITFLFMACNKAPKDNRTRIVFDAGRQRVISHAVNKQLETMAVLYGNVLAYNAALADDGRHTAGEQYTLVTWQYHENPLWYGSKVNGELLSVEQLHVTASGQMDYQVTRGRVLPVKGRQQSPEQRIRYLLSYKPSIMP